MRVIVFGATGMVGQGVLRQCLLADDVEAVAAVGRSGSGQRHSKLIDIVHKDLSDLSAVEEQLRGYDACFFALGVSSVGMTEADYERVTYGFTIAAGEMLARVNSGMTFVYVSGMGTDSSEQGRTMWARVKGRTENALLRLPLEAYMFRPGFIQPLDGIRSRTGFYNAMYTLLRPLVPVFRLAMPNQFLTTRQIGQAMLNVARRGHRTRILEVRDIREAAQA
ncbi:MAG: NAD(P)H-binding protein [Terracidiphilus sp.]